MQCGLPPAAQLLRALIDDADVPTLPQTTPPPAPSLPARPGVLGHAETAGLLRTSGVPRVESVVVADPLALDAGALRFPVVLKGLVPGVIHKTERRLVAVGLADPLAVRVAADAMRAANPGLIAFELQPMLAGLEFLVGIKRGPGFGSVVILGWGGILAEAMGARAVEMAPIDRPLAAAMIARVDAHGLLDGVRGGPGLARAALTDTIVAVGRLAHGAGDRIVELDLNPVIVGTTTATAVDAVVILA